MKRLQSILPGFLPNESMEKEFVFYDPWDEPFRLTGLWRNPDREYRRLPADVAENTSEGVARLALHTAGACIRFATDAKRMALALILRLRDVYGTMTVNGVSSPEVYVEKDGKEQQVAILRPPFQEDNLINPVMQCAITLPGEGVRTVCIYLPLCNGVKGLLIGLPEGCAPSAPRPRRIEKPILFYGSSITQGMCAAMPGACFSAILGRRLDAVVYNLGFAGNAKAEPAIAEYIAAQEMSAFIYDYDHNAPTPEYLAETHERMFQTIRAAQPDLPVIMTTKPDYDTNPEVNERRWAIVRKTYENAVAAGDQNVFFVDGKKHFGETERTLCFADDVHPNTLGFLRMSDNIEPTLRRALKLTD